MVAAFKRKRDNISKDHKGNQEKKIHKSLRDNPRPIVTPALRKKKENELKVNPTPKQTSSQIHPSIMSQPLINLEKQKEKEIRDKERASTSQSPMEITDIDLSNRRKEKEKGKEVSDTELASTSTSPIEIVDIDETDHIISNNDENSIPNNTLNKLINDKLKVNKLPGNKIPRVPRKIQMIADHLPYNVIKDLNTTKCNITFGELFEVSPKIRSQVAKGLKLEKDSIKIAGAVDNICATTTIVNNLDHTYKSKNKEPKEDDIAMVDVTVEGVKGKALIDSCSNLNIITNQFLRKLPSVYEPIGISRGRIRLATINDDYSEDYLINIPVQINNFHMVATCRVIDKEDPFFDILINF